MTVVSAPPEPVRPLLFGFLLLAIALLAVASLPRAAVPDPRLTQVLVRHRGEIAYTGGVTLAIVAVAYAISLL